ncbi:MAG: RNA polymerase sigma factor [Planctomycetota bacterium]
MVNEPDLESLAERYPRIYRAALAMTGNASDADDLAQETFLQAMGSLRRFSGASCLDTWLYSVLLNQHRRQLRARRRRERRWRVWLAAGRNSPSDDGPDRRLQLQQWRESLWSRVAELPESQRHAIVLRYSEQLAYQQIAEVLDCPIGTVKSRLHHGLAVLRRKLQGEQRAVSGQQAASTASAPCRRGSSPNQQSNE